MSNAATKTAGTKTYARLISAKATWQMTADELARVWAAHYNWRTRNGGWIYDDKGTPVVQGWAGLARELERRGYIEVGAGICWRATPATPRFTVAPYRN